MVNINVKQLGNMDWRQLVAVVEIGGVSKNTLLRDLTLKVDLKASHKNGYVNLTGNLEAPNAEGQRNNNFTIFYNVAGDKLVLNSGGVLTKTFWQSTVDLNMKTLANQIVGISLDPCHLTMNFVDESPLNGFNTDLSCRGQGRRQHLSSENIIGLFIPQKIRFDLNGAIAFHKAEERNLLETHLSLSIDRIASDLYHMEGQVLLDGTVDLDEGKNSNHEAKFAIGFEIPDFQKVVHKLATTNISIPAPLNQLKGSASCDANGRFRTVQSLNQFPIFCQSQLASAEQKVNLKITSNLELKKLTSSYRPHLDGDILVDDVLFTMPDIDIRKPIPQIFPDKRFVTLDDLAKEGIKNSKPDPISYNFRVHTSEDRPLRFKTELLPNVIPISLDLKLKDDSKMQGVVAVHDYQITLFKRTAQIENIEVVFAANREIQDIKGRIRFPNKDYFLGMDIYGTLQEPSYNFFSNPPLDSNQILGLLLFGEDPSNLDDETQRSIGNTQTAMADKAVGLLSMYYLASTPIERLGYDSNAQVFTAQFRLVDGVRLTLGSDAGSKGTVGLRKKLKGNWSIETTAERDSDTDAQKGRASLNWSKRF